MCLIKKIKKKKILIQVDKLKYLQITHDIRLTSVANTRRKLY